ncbi:MAG: hypothetical protein R2932_22810 [Caldilineaceae bacterium]
MTLMISNGSVARVLIIDKGKLIYDGALAEIKRRFGRRRQLTFRWQKENAGGWHKTLQPSAARLTAASKYSGTTMVRFMSALIHSWSTPRHSPATLSTATLSAIWPWPKQIWRRSSGPSISEGTQC